MKTKSAILAAAGLCLVGAAHADVSAFAEIHNLQFQLVDLDPSDGIAPAITFQSGPSGAYTVMVAYSPLQHYLDEPQGSAAFGNVASAGSFLSPNMSTSSGVNGDLFTGNLTIYSYASVAPLKAHDDDGATASAYGVGYGSRFTLSAHTELIVTGSVTSSYTTSGSAFEEVSTDAMFQIGGQTFESSFAKANGSLGASSTRAITATFTNSSGGAEQSSIAASTKVTAYSSSVVVPEPANVAMLLAGLGLLGLRRRRG